MWHKNFNLILVLRVYYWGTVNAPVSLFSLEKLMKEKQKSLNTTCKLTVSSVCVSTHTSWIHVECVWACLYAQAELV